MSFSDYLENELLDHVFGNSAYSAPATLYVALGTDASPSDTTFTEASGTNYARVAVTNNTTNWNTAASGATSNKTAIAFPTAGGAWGTVTCFAIYDASSGGNQIAWGVLAASQAVVNTDTPTFAASALNITLD